VDGAHQPEGDDAQPIGAIGHVLGQAEELERRQGNRRAVTSEDTDEAADEARYGDEDLLEHHHQNPPSPLASGSVPFYGLPRAVRVEPNYSIAANFSELRKGEVRGRLLLLLLLLLLL
jgi:hypothetical protein